MSTQQNIVGPLDYARCKNSEQHGPLLHDMVTKFNETHGLMVNAKSKVDKTEFQLENFKIETTKNFELVDEKINNIKKDIETTQTAISGVTTTADLNAQNKVLLAGIMEIVKGKNDVKTEGIKGRNENSKAWIAVFGSIIVALIMMLSGIFNLISNDKSEKKINVLLERVEALEQ